VQISLPKLWGPRGAQTRDAVWFLTDVHNLALCAQQNAAVTLGSALADPLKPLYEAVLNKVRKGVLRACTWKEAVDAFALWQVRICMTLLTMP
jgi:hypothetical protein